MPTGTIDGFIDRTTGAFTERLRQILAEVQARIVGRLQRDLAIDEEGKIASTPANIRALGRLDALFRAEMQRLGYDRLVDAFVAQFPREIPFFQESLEAIGRELKTPLPRIRWTARDLQAFGAQQISTGTLLDDVIAKAGEAAKRQALFSVGGLDFTTLTLELTEQFNRSISECSGLAATSMSTFYRMVADRGYGKIQEDLPEAVLQFRYEGPHDRVTRPFCERLLKSDRTYTREEIDRMDNGQIPNVFVTCGGFNCRHQWVLAGLKPVEEEESKHAA
ncbi:MAG: hypothetical protein ACE141_06000 [Bryobacteraceae bacterium]